MLAALFSPVVDKEKEKEVGPTPVVGPTHVGPTTAVDTTGPWLKARLPGEIQPSHYNITLHIDLTKPGFQWNGAHLDQCIFSHPFYTATHAEYEFHSGWSPKGVWR